MVVTAEGSWGSVGPFLQRAPSSLRKLKIYTVMNEGDNVSLERSSGSEAWAANFKHMDLSDVVPLLSSFSTSLPSASAAGAPPGPASGLHVEAAKLRFLLRESRVTEAEAWAQAAPLLGPALEACGCRSLILSLEVGRGSASAEWLPVLRSMPALLSPSVACWLTELRCYGDNASIPMAVLRRLASQSLLLLEELHVFLGSYECGAEALCVAAQFVAPRLRDIYISSRAISSGQRAVGVWLMAMGGLVT